MMHVAICGHGGQGITKEALELLNEIFEEDQKLEEEIKRRWGDAVKKFEQQILNNMIDLAEVDPNIWVTAAAVEPMIITEQIKRPEEYYNVMSHYGHIRDKPEEAVFLHV